MSLQRTVQALANAIHREGLGRLRSLVAHTELDADGRRPRARRGGPALRRETPSTRALSVRRPATNRCRAGALPNRVRRYGYGVFIGEYYDPPVVSHGGSTPGFLAEWGLVPELGFGVFAPGG